ncbi:hypothetical protein F4778DRAFT_529981 [Xylariomycetidae sp. FL2044]|nr:hypothetical protein F4778DRAFT_529981 [Xylariomycetidae sp. FL2044]
MQSPRDQDRQTGHRNVQAAHHHGQQHQFANENQSMDGRQLSSTPIALPSFDFPRPPLPATSNPLLSAAPNSSNNAAEGSTRGQISTLSRGVDADGERILFSPQQSSGTPTTTTTTSTGSDQASAALPSSSSPPPPSTPASSLPAAMRYMHDSLAILNAEQYNDGGRVRRPAPVMQAKMGKPLASPTNTTASKKRGRKPNADDAPEVEEETKRARGRPRLHTKDETTAERRRTQIRLAQRAYRSRKENAITDLEAQVSGLREGNREIREAYQRLYDFAASQGVLTRAPELGRKLRGFQDLLVKRTREHDLQALQEVTPDRESSDDLSRVYAQPLTEESPLHEHQQQHQQPQPQQQHHQHQNVDTIPKPNAPQHLWGGILVSHEPVPVPIIQEATPQSSLDSPLTGDQLHYEVVVAPTSQNASFPPNMAFDAGALAIQHHQHHPIQQQPHQNHFQTHQPHHQHQHQQHQHHHHTHPVSSSAAAAPAWMQYSPWSSLPAQLPDPRSFAYTEGSFARRLHREASEGAAALITHPHPPPEMMTRVFGFVRLFETMEEIRDRTLATLARTRDRPLCNYNYPFQHLGGAGTTFPEAALPPDAQHQPPPTTTTRAEQQQQQQQQPGGPGIVPARGWFGVGPMKEETMRVRDTLLGISQYINLPGWDGTWFDAYEASWYLSQNGIVVSGAADLQEVVVWQGPFFAHTAASWRDVSSPAHQHQPMVVQDISDVTTTTTTATDGMLPPPPPPPPPQQTQTHSSPPSSSSASTSLSMGAAAAAYASPVSSVEGGGGGGMGMAMPPLSLSSSSSSSQAGGGGGGTGGDSWISSQPPAPAPPAPIPAIPGPSVVVNSMGADFLGIHQQHTAASGDNNSTGGASQLQHQHQQQHFVPTQAVAAAAAVQQPARKVILSVDRFIACMNDRGTCLGRAPAFRPKDIIEAFWESVVRD